MDIVPNFSQFLIQSSSDAARKEHYFVAFLTTGIQFRIIKVLQSRLNACQIIAQNTVVTIISMSLIHMHEHKRACGLFDSQYHLQLLYGCILTIVVCPTDCNFNLRDARNVIWVYSSQNSQYHCVQPDRGVIFRFSGIQIRSTYFLKLCNSYFGTGLEEIQIFVPYNTFGSLG